MIGKLRGIVDEIGEDFLILDVNGVGYTVFAATKTLMAMPAPGGHAALYTDTHVREDHIHLYGFLSKQDLTCFRTITTVQGVGVKMALAILSLYGGQELAHILAAQDKRALTAVSGVGPKLAERMITELKNKAHLLSAPLSVHPNAHTATGALQASAPIAADGEGNTKTSKRKKTAQTADATPAPAPAPTLSADAVSALANLGFARADAFASVSRYLQHTPDADLDMLIKHALQELAA